MTTVDIVHHVATLLAEARAQRRAIAPIRTLVPARDLDAAYSVQALGAAQRLARGEVRVGRKVGVTSLDAQAALAVDEPNYGMLFDAMSIPADGPVDLARFIAPRIEGEVAFRIGKDIAQAPDSVDEMTPYVEAACAALEIVDSAIIGWNVDIVDATADNGCAAGFVLGAWRHDVPWRDLTSAQMRLACNGGDVSLGGGAAMPGGPLQALAWLARTSVRAGDPLRAGEVVLTGALGRPAPLSAGLYDLSITGFAPLRVHAGRPGA